MSDNFLDDFLVLQVVFLDREKLKNCVENG